MAPVIALFRPLNPMLAAGCLLFLMTVCPFAEGQEPVWVSQGPAPNTHGQVEKIGNGEVNGAIRAVALHPRDPNIVYVGAVNGGIWKTTSAMDARPTWNQQTDDQRSLSIGALEFDRTDPKAETLVAGTGRFSSLAQYGGVRTGLLRTMDGGASWTALDGGGALSGLNISSIAPRGQVIVISVNGTDDCDATGNCQKV